MPVDKGGQGHGVCLASSPILTMAVVQIRPVLVVEATERSTMKSTEMAMCGEPYQPCMKYSLGKVFSKQMKLNSKTLLPGKI